MNLIKSTGTFSFFTIISRLLGYLRDILIAIFLGVGPLADAFFVAFRIPNTFRRLFSEGTFNAAFVPSYASEIANGREQSDKFANNVFNLLILSLFFIVLLIEILMPAFVYLIAPGFNDDIEKMELAINLTRITFPFLFFVSLSSFFSAILNSHNRFAIASAAPIILNILLLAVLFCAKILNDRLVFYLSYAVTLSGIVQFIFLYIFVKKFYLPKFTFKIKIDKNNNGVFVSMNFKTDLLLSMVRGAKRFQYIRGDLFSNYYYSYGLMGVVLAKINYRLSKYFTATLVLNEKIFSHVKCQKNVKIIGNLIDESQLVQYQAETISNKDEATTKFIFVGSIDQRKRPDLLISAAIYLKSQKVNFELFILGDGPMMHSVKAMVKKNNLTNNVKIYGHVKNLIELPF